MKNILLILTVILLGSCSSNKEYKLLVTTVDNSKDTITTISNKVPYIEDGDLKSFEIGDASTIYRGVKSISIIEAKSTGEFDFSYIFIGIVISLLIALVVALILNLFGVLNL